jgi:hypothetical protein
MTIVQIGRREVGVDCYPLQLRVVIILMMELINNDISGQKKKATGMIQIQIHIQIIPSSQPPSVRVVVEKGQQEVATQRPSMTTIHRKRRREY